MTASSAKAVSYSLESVPCVGRGLLTAGPDMQRNLALR